MTLRPRLLDALLFLFALSLTAFATQSEDVMMYLVLARDFIFGGLRGDVDPYLYARAAAPLTWTHEWLSYVLYYAAWTAGGVVGLIVFKMGVLALTFAVILRRDDTGEAASPGPLWSGLWILGMTAASFRFIERSSAFLDLFAAYLTARFLRESRLGRRFALELGLIFWLWAQLHPSYPLGFALLGLWVVHRRAWSWWLALPILSPLANPDGWRGYVYPLTFALNEGRVFKHYNFEWFATYHPAFRFAPEVLAYWVFAGVALALLARARRPRDLRTWLTLFALVIGTCTVRFVPLAVFTSLIALRPWGRLEFVRVPRFVGAVALVLLAGLAGRNFVFGYESSSGRRLARFDFDPKYFPKATLETLRRQPIPGRLYNSHDFGAQLIWEKMAPVFHHGFVTDVQFYRDEVIGALRSREEFLNLAAKYEWTMLLVEKRNAYRTFFAHLKDLPEWKIVAEDDAAYLIYKLPEASDVPAGK